MEMDNRRSCDRLLFDMGGQGTLRFDDYTQLDCEFRLHQLADGKLHAYCRSTIIDRAAAMGHRHPRRLVGKVKDGARLVFPDLVSVDTQVDCVAAQAHLCLIVSGKQIRVGTPPSRDDYPLVFTFGLINLRLVPGGDAPTTHEDLQERFATSLVFDGVDVTIYPVQDYRRLVYEIAQTKQANVTCEARCQATSIAEGAAVLSTIDDLCAVLSRARGYRTAWAYCDVTDTSGRRCVSYRRNPLLH